MTAAPGRVFITGIGLHPFGRFDNADLTGLGSVAVSEAIADADADRSSIDATFCATAYGGVATGHRVLGALAMTGPPIIDVEAGCASGGAALQLAHTAVAAGLYRRVLVVGVEKMPRGVIRSSFFPPWMETAGLTPAPAYFALRAQRLLAEQGLTKEHLAALVVKNRRQGAANPDAMFRTEVTSDEVLASRVVCEPLHLWMLCSPNEGAAALVVEAERRRSTDVEVAAVELRSHTTGHVLGEDSPLAGIDHSAIVPPSTVAARAAYEATGIGPDDLDVVECQDTDAGRELQAWVELGLCAPGEQAAVLAEGRFDPGGRLTVNPSGGLLSKGEPLGASAVGQVVELVRQLRGQAGQRQVQGARTAMSHVIGRGANACVTILRS